MLDLTNSPRDGDCAQNSTSNCTNSLNLPDSSALTTYKSRKRERVFDNQQSTILSNQPALPLTEKSDVEIGISSELENIQ